MSEEQNKQKPKTTLIKHKKSEAPAEQPEKKKVKVVLKRKAKPKVVAKKSAESDAPSTVEAKSSGAPDAAKSVDSAERAASPTAKEAPQTKPVDQESAKADAPREPARRPTAGEGDAARPTRPMGSPRGETRRPSGDRPPRPTDGSGRPTRPGPRSDQGRTPSDSRYGDTRGRSGPPRPGTPGGRSDGPPRYDRGRPSGGRPPGSDNYNRSRSGPGTGPSDRSGGAPGRGRPSGGFDRSRPSGGRPPGGGPGRGPAGGGGFDRNRRGGSTPPPADQNKKPGGKKFFKSKKPQRSFDRDRYQEKELSFGKKKQKSVTNPVPKEIDIMEVITVSDLARKMNLKASELIGKLMGMGVMATINQQIDAETAEILAGEYSCKVNIVSLYDETIIESTEDADEDKAHRPPIVTVMGHVDHGKTKLLDAIRSTDVVADEHGGITQHIGAYQVTLDSGKITFLDTPGHEAFTLMRARGAQVTDIVILVVAANDGVMPQTIEAINHAKEAKVPIIVAINKIDLPEANRDRVKQQLSDHGLMPEDWGGETIFAEVSALKREGIQELLEAILLQAEVMELKAAHDRNAEGKVIESRIDPGRGTVATVLIERGTLRVGDSFVAGIFPGKVRAMFDDRGRKITEAPPSMPVEIIGFDGVPDAGDPFQTTENEKSARQVGDKRQELKRVEEAGNVKKITLDNLYDSIQEGAMQELKVVIKGDVHGSVEALQSALERLNTEEIRLSVIHASAGAINERDIVLAAASDAIVVGFHVRPTARAAALADQEKVEIRKYNVIYDVVEDIRTAMEGMLAPDLKEEVIGQVEVRDVFKVPKIGAIAGSYVTDGHVVRGAKIRVFRDSVQIYDGAISSLRRFKDDAKRVESGYECGIGLENFTDLQVGDQFEVYVMKEVAKKLGPATGKKS